MSLSQIETTTSAIPFILIFVDHLPKMRAASDLLPVLFRRRRVVRLRLLLPLLLLSFANAFVLRLDHVVELSFLFVTGQRAADLVDRLFPERVDLLQLRIARR